MAHFVPRHSRDEEDGMIPLPSVQFYTEYNTRYDIPVPAVRLSSELHQRHDTASDNTHDDSESDEDHGTSSAEPNTGSHDSQKSRLLFVDQDSLVTWSGPDDPSNPLNWSRPRKWISTLLVSCFTFISPVSSTMVAPALSTMANEFQIQSDIKQYLLMSIFLLAYALGPFIIAPLSEMYGRVIVLQSANMFYLVFNTMCGFATSGNQMLAFRFLSGLGGSAPQAIGGGVLSDCWHKEERGAATAIYSLMPFIGPAVGPIAGGYLTNYLTWRWIFWVVSMADAFVQLLALLFLRETYAPKILATRKRKLQELTGNHRLHTEYDKPDRTFGHVLRKNLIRPFRMLFTQPAIQALSLYRGYQYGLMYLVLASFPLVWEGAYSQGKDIASLNYISLGVGFVIGLQFCGRAVDIIYVRLQKRYDHPGRPEFRIPLMLPGGLLVPSGLFLYGWSAQYHTHWVVPNIGAAIFAIGLIISFQCAQTYVVDAYTRYAASATGAAAFVRTLAGFAFPLFAESLYHALGLGWGNSLLAFVSLALGIAAPLLLWYHGEWLRAKSPYCAG
ncbi:major facilitator superfamily domain-containing protein [Aspergillus pseudotamarii]|uniref:Major facilitator superfamily domain-containing protein n=1 Tax=Aspergillus pseudotamarii TaxID=132259 RepID=A0A5N6SVB9_ASPPS|nr:major facilitator superfamily domain-containing protein [Aspergillus pseudotamarii]KAE8137837.1 major facilitator superfamily domain-containing protein [Aspergillus pseudotamarii]